MLVDQLIMIRGARQLVTLRGPALPRRGDQLRDIGIISDGAMLIRNGIIEDVGISRRVERLASARRARVIDATGRIVIPAFVDSLARVAFSHFAVFSDQPQDGPGPIPGILEAARSFRLSPRLRIETRCRALLSEMLRHGTATAEAETGYGLDESGELKTLRVYRSLDGDPIDLIATFLASIPAPGFERDPSTYLTTVAIPILRIAARRKLARFADIRCAPDGFTVTAARVFLDHARGFGLGVKVQAHDLEPDESIGLAVAIAATSVSHVERISPADIALVAGSGVIATLCPGASYESRAGRFAPARDLMDGGAAVSLASNFNVESSPFYSMPFILSLACRHMNMTPAEALAAATINAAYAVGCGSSIGSIEPGKKANVLILNARDYREIPYFAGANPVHAVLRNGDTVS